MMGVKIGLVVAGLAILAVAGCGGQSYDADKPQDTRAEADTRASVNPDTSVCRNIYAATDAFGATGPTIAEQLAAGVIYADSLNAAADDATGTQLRADARALAAAVTALYADPLDTDIETLRAPANAVRGDCDQIGVTR